MKRWAGVHTMTPNGTFWCEFWKLACSGRGWTAIVLASVLALAALQPTRPAHAVNPSPAFSHGAPAGGNFVPGATLNWLFLYSNSDGIGQADNPGDEIVVVLPSQVQLISATFSGLGTLLVDIPSNTVTVNRAIGPIDVQLLEIVTQIRPGTEGQVVTGAATMNYDADVNGSNETSKTVFATSFTVAGSVAAGTTSAGAGQEAANRKVDSDDQPRLSRQQRREQERTNRLGEDDYELEGNVIAVHADREPPEIVVANRDGDVRVILQCGSECPVIRVGDYVRVAGTKEHELLFYAEDVSVERH